MVVHKADVVLFDSFVHFVRVQLLDALKLGELPVEHDADPGQKEEVPFYVRVQDAHLQVVDFVLVRQRLVLVEAFER